MLTVSGRKVFAGAKHVKFKKLLQSRKNVAKRLMDMIEQGGSAATSRAT